MRRHAWSAGLLRSAPCCANSISHYLWHLYYILTSYLVCLCCAVVATKISSGLIFWIAGGLSGVHDITILRSSTPSLPATFNMFEAGLANCDGGFRSTSSPSARSPATLSPPKGHSLAVEMTDHGFVGVRLTLDNYAHPLDSWAQQLEKLCGVDHNNSYPVALAPDSDLVTFLPLHPKQNTNMDATLIPPTEGGVYYTLHIPL